MKNSSRRLAGFTLDQTILVVAVIAILATIIISSVAWNVLNKANATKLNAHFTQINDAIGQFYQDNDYRWPTNAAALAPYLAGYNIDSGGNDLETPFGTSSAVSILSITDGNGSTNKTLSGNSDCGAGDAVDCYITITMTNVQVQELRAANENIDGAGESNRHTSGRLRWAADTSASARVTATYFGVKLY